jgi:pimeloyl-ACP methyl ester carboxylesterase
MAVFEHDGIQFHYRDEGTGLAVVLQHGLGADVSQPFSLFKPPAGCRLIAFDVRAHGLTRPAGDHAKLGFSTFADDLRALLDHLALERPIIGGISMGAGIALNFTLRHPGRASGLILSRPAWLDQPCPWNVTMFSLISRIIRDHGRLQGKIRFLETAEYLEAKARWPDVANSLAGQFDSPDVEETCFKFERIIKDVPNLQRADWEGIHVPTLILANRQDPVHPFDDGEILAAAIPGSQLREITSKSVSMEAHTRDVQRCLEAFLREQFSVA